MASSMPLIHSVNGNKPTSDVLKPKIEPNTSSSPTTLLKGDRQALLEIILADHVYAKPYSMHPDANRIQPARTLQFSRKRPLILKGKDAINDKELDVVTYKTTTHPLVSYDNSKSKGAMTEMEKMFENLFNTSNLNEDDDQFVRVGWTKPQEQMFDKVYKILSSYLLARRAYHLHVNEPVLRRVALDKAASRLRHSFGKILWDAKLTSWLHGVLVDGLNSSLFLCYLEILQTLRSKVPNLVDKLLNTAAYVSPRKDVMLSPGLCSSLKKNWDPAVGLSSRLRQLKFPQTPFFIIVPCGPNVSSSSPKRSRFWHSQLSSYGKVIPVNMHISGSQSEIDTKHFLEHLVSAVRSKVAEFRTNFSDRPIVLVGWSVGALIACKVAGIEKISALCCLGFPCVGPDGEGEMFNDPLPSITCPTMFVIGTHDRTTSVSRVEEFRKKLKVNNRLLIVPTADRMLRITSMQKKRLQLTQNMVDRLIQDEVNLFLMNTFAPDPTPRNDGQTGRSSPSLNRLPLEKKKKKKRPGSPSTSESNIPLKKKKKVIESNTKNKTQITSTTSNGTTKSVGTDPSLSLATLLKLPPGQKPKTTKSHSTSNESKSTASNIGMKRPAPSNKSQPDRHLKKSKINIKKPMNNKPNVLPYSGTSYITTTQPGMITLQGLNSGSIFLSSAGGQVRLQQGSNVLYMPNSSTVTLPTNFRTVTTNAAPGTTQHVVSSVVSKTSTMLTYQLTGNTTKLPASANHPLRSNVVLNPATQSLGTKASATIPPTSAILTTQGGRNVNVRFSPVPVQTASDTTRTPSSSQTITTTTTVTTNLTPADLQYLATLLSKQQQQQLQQKQIIVSGVSTMTSTPVKQRTVAAPVSTKTSPIGLSTKISIGTLSSVNTATMTTNSSNYPLNATVPTASSPSSTFTVKSSPQSKPIPVNPAAKTTSISQNQAVQQIPVTLTIPLSSLSGLSIAVTGTSKSIVSGGQRTFTLSQSGALSALLAQQKLILSPGRAPSTTQKQSNVTVTSSRGLMRTQSTPAPVVTHHKRIGNILPATSLRSTHVGLNPLTKPKYVTSNDKITVRLPQQAVFQDQKLKAGNFSSEIKLIGLVNRSSASNAPIPVRQTQSAPVSPLTISPNVPSKSSPSATGNGLKADSQISLPSESQNLSTTKPSPCSSTLIVDAKPEKPVEIINDNKLETSHQTTCIKEE